ncbi:putative lipopolysaccharide heptosyltransferase III [Mixta mediterraneensis]|uniref:putative lipopolysaccharide heptosyltransferase III n=1 Tax=Mixta mediterraneensis TaxID=2758443 RepID=UPI0018760C43|nr:putative lipopolysaccharide heptosyltransferase III [Mixta mediterraneensis]MBE5253806.1 putative lipopolysaccharide heptosyltransferase III [Mixta mediterraneensis]
MKKIKIKKILVIKFRFHGDMLLITPVISSLKANHPDAIIDVLGYEGSVEILRVNDDVDKIFAVKNKKASFSNKTLDYLKVVHELQKEKYDLVVNLSDQWLSGLMTRLISPRYSVAFEFQQRNQFLWRLFFHELVKPEGTHVVERNLSILNAFDFPVTVKNTKMGYHAFVWEGIKFRLGKEWDQQKYVVVQPTARQKFKYWDDEKFAEVIDYIQRVTHHKVIITCGPSEDDKRCVARIVELCKVKPVMTLAGNTTFDELAAVIDHAQFFIGVDSAPMHIAAAVETPIICLFGATDHRAWHPWTEKFWMVWAGNYHPMPKRSEIDRSFKYLSYIPVEKVIDAVNSAVTAEKAG